MELLCSVRCSRRGLRSLSSAPPPLRPSVIRSRSRTWSAEARGRSCSVTRRQDRRVRAARDRHGREPRASGSVVARSRDQGRAAAPPHDASGKRQRTRVVARRSLHLLRLRRAAARRRCGDWPPSAAKPSKSRTCRSTSARSDSRRTARGSPFRMDVFADCDDLACSSNRVKQAADSKASGRVYDRTFVRHWDTWSDGRISQLFVLEIENGRAVEPRRADRGARCGCAVEAVRRRQRVHVLARQQQARVQRAREGQVGVVVDELRSLRSERRRRRAAQSHGGQPGLGCPTRVLARRQHARVARDATRRASRPIASTSWCWISRPASAAR